MSASLSEFPTHGERHTGYTGRFYAKVRELGHGQREVCLKPYSERRYDDFGIPIRRPGWSADPVERDPEENRQRAARRAKSMVRLKCKAMAVDSLWTLTYRENVTDRAQVAKDFKAFCRRVRKVLPELHYVATLEHQARGAFHIHMATHRLPVDIRQDGTKFKSWNLLRAIWRSVAGERGGNFDEVKAKGNRKSKAHKIACYIAKYVAKAFGDGDKGERRYWSSEGIKVPEAQIIAIKADTFAEAISLCYTLFAQSGSNWFWYSEKIATFWLANEGPPAIDCPF